MNVAKAEMTPEQGMLELTLLNAESVDQSFDDIVIEGTRLGIPPEILTRLQTLWEETKLIADELIAIGRVIVVEIMKFLAANKEMTVGLALGAAVGAMVAAVPFIGPLLAPVTTAIAALYGGGVGATGSYGKVSTDPLQAALALARKFFEFFIAVIRAIACHWEKKTG